VENIFGDSAGESTICVAVVVQASQVGR
jgi:hypothetical protein